MLDDLPTGPDIAVAADRLLLNANARYRFPTPVDDLVRAAGLAEPKGFIFSDVALSQAPAHLSVLLRRVSGKIHGILDRKTREVHVNPGIQQDAHGRFVRLHEVSHDIFDWQRELAYADTELTLSPATKAMFEREANQGGSELLFQREVFRDVASDYEIGMASVVELSATFGASLRATLRRYVETHRDVVVGVVLDRQPLSTAPATFRRREAVASTSWRNRFGNPAHWPHRLQGNEVDIINVIAAGAGRNRWAGNAVMSDLAGQRVDLRVDVLDSTYQLLVVAWVLARRLRIVHRRRALAAAG